MKMKRSSFLRIVLSLALVLAMLVPSVAEAKTSHTFPDLTSKDSCYSKVKYLEKRGVFENVYSKNAKFNKSKKFTRQQMILMLYNAYGDILPLDEDEDTSDIYFSDVEEGSKYYDAAIWYTVVICNRNNHAVRSSNYYIIASAKVTRMSMANELYYLNQKVGAKLEMKQKSKYFEDYSEYASRSDDWKKIMVESNTMYRAKIITPYSSTIFSGEKAITRAQFATYLVRYMKANKKLDPLNY